MHNWKRIVWSHKSVNATVDKKRNPDYVTAVKVSKGSTGNGLPFETLKLPTANNGVLMDDLIFNLASVLDVNDPDVDLSPDIRGLAARAIVAIDTSAGLAFESGEAFEYLSETLSARGVSHKDLVLPENLRPILVQAVKHGRGLDGRALIRGV